MENSKSLDTPMSSTYFLDKYDEGMTVDETKYRGMIRSFTLSYSHPTVHDL